MFIPKLERGTTRNIFCSKKVLKTVFDVVSFQATMLKKRKHKIKRRNTEPTVNHPLVLATGSAVGPESVGACSSYGAHGAESIPEHPINLADICDSPTHATAV